MHLKLISAFKQNFFRNSYIIPPLSLFFSLSVQVNLQAAKTNYERELAQKEEAAEDARRGIIKQLRELEQTLEDERKQRSIAQSERKKMESELAEIEGQVEAEVRGREDAQKMYKKAQVLVYLCCTLL